MGMYYHAIAIAPSALYDLEESPPALLEEVLESVRPAGTQDARISAACDLHKNWDALSRVLGILSERTATPLLDNVVFGGRDLPVDFGYGPARARSPAEVQRTSEALNQITREQLGDAIDAWLLSGIDAHGGSDGPRLTTSFVELSSLFQRAASAGHAIVSFLE